MNSVSVHLDSARPCLSGAIASVRIHTFGCKVNTYESEIISQTLGRGKWRLAGKAEEAGVHIINTCTVTREADRQARQLIRRIIREAPAAVIVVTGCYAQMDPEACAAIPGVDYVIGNDRKLDLPALLPALLENSLPSVLVGDLDKQVTLPQALLTGYDGRTRAYVQIQQGCNQGCTYCIIHRARGPSRSLPVAQVKRQVERLVINGYREIVLCGVDLGDYVDEDNTGGLLSLLQSLASIEGDFQIRLGSLDPAHMHPDLVKFIVGNRKMCPHLHLSLQSGSSLILKRMKRRYTADLVYQRVFALQEMAKEPLVLTADIMVGFPTETETDFQASANMLRRLGIVYPHLFIYSPRPGTPAARIPRQVAANVARQRMNRLRLLAEKNRRQLFRQQIGRHKRVLLEQDGEGNGGQFTGRGSDYLPVRVAAMGRIGRWLDTEIIGTNGSSLIAMCLA